jgi:hypothetical protein
MTFTLTTPRLLVNWDPLTGESLQREERGVLDVSKDATSNLREVLSNLAGSTNLVPHLGESPKAVAAAARAVVSWARALANHYESFQ